MGYPLQAGGENAWWCKAADTDLIPRAMYPDLTDG